MNRKEHTLWVSKYRPETLESYASTPEVAALFKGYVEKQDIDNLLLHGIQGTGKTSASKLLSNLIECDRLYINASDERKIETIRDKVVGFATTRTMNNLKIITLDECESITYQGQAALKSVMEMYDMSVRFILTTNHPDKLMDAIRSRCTEIAFTGIPKQSIASVLYNILEAEKVKFELEDIKTLVNTHYPDLRKTIRDAQRFTVNGVLSVPKNLKTLTTEYDPIISVLTNSPTSKSWATVRQFVADSGIKTFEPLYSYIYEKIDMFPEDKQPRVIVLVAEAQYQSSFVIDKEITFMACIAQILS